MNEKKQTPPSELVEVKAGAHPIELVEMENPDVTVSREYLNELESRSDELDATKGALTMLEHEHESLQEVYQRVFCSVSEKRQEEVDELITEELNECQAVKEKHDAEIKSMEKLMKEAENRITLQMAQINNLKEERAKLEVELLEIEKLKQRNERLEKDIFHCNEEAEDLERRLSDVRASKRHLEEAYEEIKEERNRYRERMIEAKGKKKLSKYDLRHDLQSHREKLAKLEKKVLKITEVGGHVPLELENMIETHEQTILMLESAIFGFNSKNAKFEKALNDT